MMNHKLIPPHQAHNDLADTPPTDMAGLLDEVDAIIAAVPVHEWQKLPRDLSLHLDHYLYGAPK